MLMTRRHAQTFSFRSSHEGGPDTRFPRAVPGEAFDRYARVAWHQGQRWMRKHWHRVTGPDVSSMHDAREALRSVAAFDLSRRLYPQEEQLLSEVLHQAWNDAPREIPDIVPESAQFLQADVPAGPRPAA